MEKIKDERTKMEYQETLQAKLQSPLTADVTSHKDIQKNNTEINTWIPSRKLRRAYI